MSWQLLLSILTILCLSTLLLYQRYRYRYPSTRVMSRKSSIMNEKGHLEYATILALMLTLNVKPRRTWIYVSWWQISFIIFSNNFHASWRSWPSDEGRKLQRKSFALLFWRVSWTRSTSVQIPNLRSMFVLYSVAVFPSIIKILPQHVFNQKDSKIVGV